MNVAASRSGQRGKGDGAALCSQVLSGPAASKRVQVRRGGRASRSQPISEASVLFLIWYPTVCHHLCDCSTRLKSQARHLTFLAFGVSPPRHGSFNDQLALIGRAI